MSFRTVMHKRSYAPVAVAVSATALTLFPTTLQAETIPSTQSKKPIYDDYEDIPTPTQSPTTTTPTTTTPTSTRIAQKTPSPSPTDRLASQIAKTRLFLHSHVASLENGVNNTLTRALNLENNFTSTIADLAPSRASGERLMPGSIYVLVAAMTGSIVARNRNILLRASLPLAVGVGAGWVVLPVTMRNVSELLWRYEKRFPAVAELHLRTRGGLEKAWETVRVQSKQAAHKVDEKVGEGRDVVEGWVRKGR